MKKRLSKIVSEFIDSKDGSSHEYRRLWNIAVRGMGEFNRDICGELVTVILDVNANKTVTLPDDYLQYSKIGVMNQNGEVVTFKVNNQLSGINSGLPYLSDRNNGAPEAQSLIGLSNFTSYPFYYYNYWSIGTSYILFGLPSGTGNIGEFNVDEESGVILLDPQNAYKQIVLEYLSSSMEDEDYLLDDRAEEAMICYLRWKNATDLIKKYGAGMVQMYKKEYYRERRLAKMRINKSNVNEMVDTFRRSVKLVARA